MTKKPVVPGLYVVARFEGNKMIAYDTNWALVDGYWGPNNIGYQENIHPTHWMSRSDYRSLLESADRE